MSNLDYIWRKILVTKFNFRLKEEIATVPCVLHLQSNQANSTRGGPYHNNEINLFRHI
jgi:hypothetical protein